VWHFEISTSACVRLPTAIAHRCHGRGSYVAMLTMTVDIHRVMPLQKQYIMVWCVQSYYNGRVLLHNFCFNCLDRRHLLGTSCILHLSACYSKDQINPELLFCWKSKSCYTRGTASDLGSESCRPSITLLDTTLLDTLPAVESWALARGTDVHDGDPNYSRSHCYPSPAESKSSLAAWRLI
jgi:hypothetical protein